LKNSIGTFQPKLGTHKSFALLKISILAVLLTISSYDTIFVKSVEQNYCQDFYDKTKTKILNNKNAALTVEEVWNIIFRFVDNFWYDDSARKFNPDGSSNIYLLNTHILQKRGIRKPCEFKKSVFCHLHYQELNSQFINKTEFGTYRYIHGDVNPFSFSEISNLPALDQKVLKIGQLVDYLNLNSGFLIKCNQSTKSLDKSNKSACNQVLTALQKENWIDSYTRAVIATTLQAHQNNRFIVEKSLLLEFSTLVGTFFQSDCKVHNFGSQIPNLIMISMFITQWTSLLVFQIFLAASSGMKFSKKNAHVFFEVCKCGLYSIFIGVIVWKILFISRQEFSSSAILSDKGLIIKVSNIKNLAQFLTHSSQFFAFLDSMISVLPLIASMYNKKISLRRLKQSILLILLFVMFICYASLVGSVLFLGSEDFRTFGQSVSTNLKILLLRMSIQNYFDENFSYFVVYIFCYLGVSFKFFQKFFQLAKSVIIDIEKYDEDNSMPLFANPIKLLEQNIIELQQKINREFQSAE